MNLWIHILSCDSSPPSKRSHQKFPSGYIFVFGWGTKVYVQNWLEPSNRILHRFCLTRESTITSQDYSPSSVVCIPEPIRAIWWYLPSIYKRNRVNKISFFLIRSALHNSYAVLILRKITWSRSHLKQTRTHIDHLKPDCNVKYKKNTFGWPLLPSWGTVCNVSRQTYSLSPKYITLQPLKYCTIYSSARISWFKLFLNSLRFCLREELIHKNQSRFANLQFLNDKIYIHAKKTQLKFGNMSKLVF